jgi:hypothetical protein
MARVARRALVKRIWSAVSLSSPAQWNRGAVALGKQFRIRSGVEK